MFGIQTNQTQIDSKVSYPDEGEEQKIIQYSRSKLRICANKDFPFQT